MQELKKKKEDIYIILLCLVTSVFLIVLDHYHKGSLCYTGVIKRTGYVLIAIAVLSLVINLIPALFKDLSYKLKARPGKHSIIARGQASKIEVNKPE